MRLSTFYYRERVSTSFEEVTDKIEATQNVLMAA